MSSHTRNTVLVISRPGTAAIRTARTRNLVHSTVSVGQRPISRNPDSAPSDTIGATSTAERPSTGPPVPGVGDESPTRQPVDAPLFDPLTNRRRRQAQRYCPVLGAVSIAREPSAFLP